MSADSYKKSMDTCEADDSRILTKSATYKKSGTNHAAALIKLGQREEATDVASKIHSSFGNESKIFNNIGIIQKRQGNTE